MSKNIKKVITILTMILLFLGIIFGLEITVFSDLGSENLSFKNASSYTRTIEVDYRANFSSATFNLTGFSYPASYSVVDSYCYQESSNTSNQGGMDGSCNLNYTGNYTFSGSFYVNGSALIDGDFSTFSYVGALGSWAYLNINYTKPNSNNLSGAIWNVKDINSTENITIPSSCYDYNSETLILRVGAYTPELGDSYADWSCYNGSWNMLRYVTTSSYGNPQIYEEAINWSLTSEFYYPYNISVNVSSYNLYTNTSYFNSTIQISDFSATLNNAINSTLCNCVGCSLVSTTCSIPIHFNANQSGGLLLYSNINLTYFLNDVAPSISSVSVNYTNDSINFYCNATDVDGDNLNYLYNIYYNNTLNFSNNQGNLTLIASGSQKSFNFTNKSSSSIGDIEIVTTLTDTIINLELANGIYHSGSTFPNCLSVPYGSSSITVSVGNYLCVNDSETNIWRLQILDNPSKGNVTFNYYKIPFAQQGEEILIDNVLSRYIVDGNWSIQCIANDNALNSTALNSSLTNVDIYSPQIIFISPDNNTKSTGSNISTNFSISEVNFKNVTTYLYNSDGSLNQSITNTSNIAYNNFTGLDYGVYYVNATTYDLFNHTNSTDTHVVILSQTAIISPEGTYASKSGIPYQIITSQSGLTLCQYWITSSTILIQDNTSITCGSNIQGTLSVPFSDASYVFHYYQNSSGGETTLTTSFNIPAGTTDGGGGGGSGGTTTRVEAENYEITSINFLKNLDISLAKDSVKSRSKPFYITNKGSLPITVDLICDTTNTTKSTRNISICDYVSFNKTTITISPNENDPYIGKVEVLTPQDSLVGDEYYFNILAITSGETTEYYSKLSVSTRVSLLAYIYKYSYIPNTDKFYLVSLLSFIIGLFLFVLSIVIFNKRKMYFSGVLVGLILLFGGFFLITSLL